jgi:hypothetical protein
MTDTFWGLTATGWTAITTLLTGGLLVVAVAGVHAATERPGGAFLSPLCDDERVKLHNRVIEESTISRQ